MKEKNKWSKSILALVIMLFVAGPLMAAQIISKAEDKSVALRVKNGYDTTLTIVVATSGAGDIKVSDGTTTNTVDGSGDIDTITEVADAITACTNAAGTASLTVNSEPSLLADSTDGELLDGTYTAAAGKWLELLWDTSECKFYSLYMPSRTYQTGVSAFEFEQVQGLPGGTGDITVNIYQDQTLIASKFYTSPAYVNPATLLVGGTNVSTNTLGIVNAVSVDWQLGLPFSGKDAVIVRATRATTATTGVLTGVVPNQ